MNALCVFGDPSNERSNRNTKTQKLHLKCEILARIPRDVRHSLPVVNRDNPLTENYLTRIAKMYTLPDRSEPNVGRNSDWTSSLPKQAMNTEVVRNIFHDTVNRRNNKTRLENTYGGSQEHTCNANYLRKHVHRKHISFDNYYSQKHELSGNRQPSNDLLPLNIPSVEHFNLTFRCAEIQPSSEYDDNNFEQSESSCSSLEDIESPRTITYDSCFDSFPKFIPVFGNVKTIRVPKILLNKRNKRELKDLQMAMTRREDIRSPTRSTSDTLLTRKTSLSRRRSFLKSFQRKSKNDINIESSDVTGRQTMLIRPRSFDGRFDFAQNEHFCQVNSCRTPNFSAFLYAELIDENSSKNAVLNHRLCHQKTELAVSALLNFFHPYSEVQCLWVRNLQAICHKMMRSGDARPKFTRFVYLHRYRAVLQLSPDAGCMLRHRNTAFVQSLAATLQIEPSSLLVMVQRDKSSSSESFDWMIGDSYNL